MGAIEAILEMLWLFRLEGGTFLLSLTMMFKSKPNNIASIEYDVMDRFHSKSKTSKPTQQHQKQQQQQQ